MVLVYEDNKKLFLKTLRKVADHYRPATYELNNQIK